MYDVYRSDHVPVLWTEHQRAPPGHVTAEAWRDSVVCECVAARSVLHSSRTHLELSCGRHSWLQQICTHVQMHASITAFFPQTQGEWSCLPFEMVYLKSAEGFLTHK